MSARDDYPWLADRAELRGDTTAIAALAEIDALRACRCGECGGQLRWRCVSGKQASIRHFMAAFKPEKVYEIVIVQIGDRRVEVCISPTGRSVQVHVDGERVA
jgi:hypothetical protein